MRLPRYFDLNDRAYGLRPLRRLTETGIVVVAALVTHALGGHDDARALDCAVIGLSLLVAWCAMSAWPSRPTSDIAIRPSLRWLGAQLVAAGIVMVAHRFYVPDGYWLASWMALTAAGIGALRLWGRAADARRARTCSVAVVGRGEHCAALVRGIASMPHTVYRIDAVFDTTQDAQDSDPAIFHDTERFAGHVRAARIDELWLALPLADEATLLRFLDLFRDDLLNIRFLPDVSRVTRFQSDAGALSRVFAINLVASPFTARALAVKTLFDRVFATCALLALSPLLVLIALAVRLSSPGPVLFRQRRRGANGQPFDILKFRTMHEHECVEGALAQATRDDPRVTRIGAFLRRTSLDELPQFINVLRGEMSVVGPRPHAIEHDALYQHVVDGYIHRYRIRPGITGWAQVNGLRGETDSIEKMHRRVEHDLYYLSNWSFGLDVRIVLKTAGQGFVHRNAY